MKKSISLLFAFLFISQLAISQISGKVTDENGEPLIGATVRWLGTESGTFTQLPDATYSISRNNKSNRLVASFVGCISDTIYVKPDQTTVNFKLKMVTLDEVYISKRGSGVVKLKGAVNSQLINQAELFKAACCNLGESFTTNPSVDVSYDDAATGARQIKLLGLSGAYVQMLTENIPNFRGAAQPYSLGYVPGPWMKSIQVSKGSSSVKNGYESITGQINIEYLKPQTDEELNINLYGDSRAKFESNVDGNIHLTGKLSTGVMFHYEDRYKNHDGNKDGFIDMPRIKQYNALNRWGYFSDKYIMQASVNYINEKRHSGIAAHHSTENLNHSDFDTNISTDRIDAWAKNAFIINRDTNTNIALITNFSRHLSNNVFTGNKTLDIRQSIYYASLIFETDLGEYHSLSSGLSFNHDNIHYITDINPAISKENETVPGVYAQYTYNFNDKFIAMAGLRYDHSNIYGAFVTPRAHLKWMPATGVSIGGSIGKGYRTVHPYAEFSYLFSSTHPITITGNPDREEAWNYGISASYSFPVSGNNLNLSAEYYYTDFSKQIIVDRISTPGIITIGNLNGKSYSHTFQIEAGYTFFQGMTINLAYRLNDVKETYNGKLAAKPLTGRYKCLISLSYLTPLELWQFDATMQINGSGNMPTPITIDNSPLWATRFPAYTQLSAQITRHFRHFSLYAGGENLTGYRQKQPVVYIPDIIYDPTMVWGPVHGAMFYAGIRLKLSR